MFQRTLQFNTLHRNIQPPKAQRNPRNVLHYSRNLQRIRNTKKTASFDESSLLFMYQRLLSFIILPLSVTHIARLEELLVHSECAAQCMRGMCGLRHLQILVQHWAILWVHTIVDNLVSALDWALTTQVSNTVLRDDDLH